MAQRRGAARSKVGRRTRFTARGWAFLAVAAVLVVCAYRLGRTELLFIGAFIAAILLLSFLLVGLQRLRLNVRRTFSPTAVTAGMANTVTLEISNLSQRAMPATSWSDRCGWSPNSSAEGRIEALRGRVQRYREPRSSARLSYQLRPPRRGVFEVGPFTVTIIDPFGLARGTQIAHQAESVTVVPEVLALPDSGLAIAEADGSARLVQHRAIGGDHDISTRAYRTGDALRRVHWRASAHHGDLMVRQEEQRSHSEASILLDTRRAGYRDFEFLRTAEEPESEAFEWAVGFTAALVLHLQHNGFRVQMHESGPTQLTSVDHSAQFLESLAIAKLSTDAPQRPSAMLAGAGQRKGRAPGSIFAVLSDADDDTTDALIAARSGFDLAIAFFVMPVQHRAHEALERSGWTCVTVRPGDSAESAWLAVMSRPGARFGSS